MDQILGTTDKKCNHVVVMPYPGRGHINPLINLSKLLVSKHHHIQVTIVVTEEWLGFLSSEPDLPANIHYATIPQVIPSELGRANDMEGFVRATLTKLQEPFELLLDRLELPATAIIYDTFMYWVVGVGKRRNVPVVSFFPMSASVFTVFYHLDMLRQHGHFPLDVSERGDEVVDYIPGLPATKIEDLTTFFDGVGEKLAYNIPEAFSVVNTAHCQLLSSVYEIEDQVIRSLKEKLSVPVYHIGPMIPFFNLNSSNELSSTDEGCFRWLNAQPTGSVLYVSQGSFLSVSSAQMNEIVEGVKGSGVRFLWITRGDNSLFKDGASELGFLAPWCNQLKVLCHPSVGGFWTHCGWNSTSEGIYAGVPMLTCPILFDQMPNSKLIVNDLKIGYRVIKNYPNTGKLVKRQEITELVKRLMDPSSNERTEMVQRVKNLQHIFRTAISKGGSAASYLDAFVKSISRD